MTSRCWCWHFSFAVQRADFLVRANDIDGAARLLVPAADKTRDRAFGGQALENDWSQIAGWVSTARGRLVDVSAVSGRIVRTVKAGKGVGGGLAVTEGGSRAYVGALRGSKVTCASSSDTTPSL